MRSSFAGEVGKGMRIAAAVLGKLLGQCPEAAVRPSIRLIDDPSPGRAAYRGATKRALTVGDQDATRLAVAVEESL
ncbi:hypothetical protein ACH347_33245 [Saccharopolyspora sp. 5N102]|uniref:hypothetical protein n=1 Tax=Saccharopolyspora sp. 5N102 TaxID=3375155 RepID=UPI0037B76637